MYKIPANTLFLGKQLVFVPECHSTNTLALQLSQNPSTGEGATVITHHQTAGRGQRGSTWETEPGMNLTFSVILRPTFLPVPDQFHLNIITSLAVRDFLRTGVEQSVHIKWPNDILIDNKKICGILIENQLQGSSITAAIVGIGLNVNQMEFPLPTATSLRKITGHPTDLEQALHGLLGHLESRYLQLRQNNRQTLRNEYLKSLYWLNESHTFDHAGRLFEGVILGINDVGQLAIETHEGMKYFGVKEIAFVK